jgi:hypothetical protein
MFQVLTVRAPLFLLKKNPNNTFRHTCLYLLARKVCVPVVYFFFQMVVMNELCHTTQVRTLEGRGGVPVNGQKSRQGIGIEMI